MTRTAIQRWLAAFAAVCVCLAVAPLGAQDAQPLLEIATGEVDAGAVRVVALHPWGGAPRAFARALHVEHFGCRARFVFPRGPHRDPPGRAWFLRRALDPAQDALASEVRTRAAELARTLVPAPPARRPPTIVAGYSEGAMLALAVGVLHPDAADDVVVAAGALPRALWPTTAPSSPRFTILHGRDDAFVPFTRTESLARSLGATFRPLDAGHHLRGDLRRAFRAALREALAARGACGRGARGAARAPHNQAPSR